MRHWIALSLIGCLSSWSLAFCQQLDSTSLPLSLEDVLVQVQRNHPKLRAADLQRQMASAKRLEKAGAFDPAITVANDTQRYNSFPTRGQAKFETLSDVSVGMLTRYGAKVSAEADYHYGDIKSPASGTGDTGTYFLGLKLPLLRGARINDKAADEKKAIIGEPLANQEFNEFRLYLLIQAANKYWNWVGAKQQLMINENLLDLSVQRVEQVEERAKAGDLPRIAWVEAQQEVQSRQEIQLKSSRTLQKEAFGLANYLWTNNGESVIRPDPKRAPDQIPVPQPLTDNDIKQYKVIALQKRPELAQIELLRDMRNVDLRVAKNKLLPILDVYTGPGYDTGPNSIGPTFKAGITLTVPLRNRTAKGQVQESRLKLEKLDYQEKAQIQEILLQVDDTASEMNMAQQRFQAAQNAYDLAKELEVGERTKFQYGDSTLFLVNQRERSTAKALEKVILIQVDYQKAAVKMMAVTGQL